MSEGSHSSGGSASTGHGGGGRSRDTEPPVPYRDAPLDYNPPVFCSCDLKCFKLISWSDVNPGRRYYRCQNVWTDRDCGYFKWIDPKYSSSLSTMLLDFRNAIWNLKREAAAEEEARIGLQMMYEKQLVEKEKHLLEIEKQLEAKVAALEVLASTKTIGRMNSSCILFVFVVGVLCGVSFSSRKTV